jgi:hypothetical protein
MKRITGFLFALALAATRIAQRPGEGGDDLPSSGLPPHPELLHRQAVRRLVRVPWRRHAELWRQWQRRRLRLPVG